MILHLQSLIKYGTELQKEKYLPKLATGEHIAAFCLSEKCGGSDINGIQATLKPSADNSHYILDGSKTWVTNGESANFLIVFAKYEVNSNQGVINAILLIFCTRKYFHEKKFPLQDSVKTQKKMVAIIIDEKSPNIEISRIKDTMGLKGAEFCNVNRKKISFHFYHNHLII